MKAIVAFLFISLIQFVPMESQVFINKSTPLSKLKKKKDKNSEVQSTHELDGLSDISTLKSENLQLLNSDNLINRIELIKEKRPDANPIAIPINTNFTINNSGKWDTLSNGDRIWRLNISMNQNGSIIAFKELSIPYGAFLHIFDKESDLSFGPLTFNTNADGGGWMTHILPFSNIVLEYVQPAEVLGTPKINIFKLGQMITNNIDSVFNPQKYNQVQSKLPQIGYPYNISDYNESGNYSLGSPVSCDDTLEAYSRSVVQYIYLSTIEDLNEYDSFDAKNGTLLSTTDPTDCKAYIATVWHVAWQDSIMMHDYVAFRFNWKRNKPDSSCCVFPKDTTWETTIDSSNIVDYCGAVSRVRIPVNSQGVGADFAIVEMLDYPIHNAYFSDWNAECLSDSIDIELKLLVHKKGWIPMMFLKGKLASYKCQSINPNSPYSIFSTYAYDCLDDISIISGDSGSGLFKKKNGAGLFDYEYIGALKSEGGFFIGLNWVYDIDISSNRPKTYLDPLNTGLLKNVGYNAIPACQTADCCELIYTKLRPEKVIANENDSCCTNLVIEEKFPDDITCGDYTVIIKRAGTSVVLLDTLVGTNLIRYPNKFTYEICEKLPIGFLNYKKFEYDIEFKKNDTTFLSCNRTLDFTCQKCDSDDLEIELFPSRTDKCCFDLKIKELSGDACQFKHVFFKLGKNKEESKFLPERLSSPNSSLIKINEDSLYINGICIDLTDPDYIDADTLVIRLYDGSIELNSYGYPLAFDENRYIKELVVNLNEMKCNCCEDITVVPDSDCGEYIITQFNTNKYYERCGKVDSVRIDLLDFNGRLIEKNIYNQGGLSSDTINVLDLNTIYGGYQANFRFYLYDQNGELICEKDQISSNCDNCDKLNIYLKSQTNNDEDPCCQILQLENFSDNFSSVDVNIYRVNLTDPNNPSLSQVLNNNPINLINSPPQTAEFEICLTEEHTTFLIEYTSSSNVVCKQLFNLSCKSCCRRLQEVKVNFEMVDDSTKCCYKMNLQFYDENCNNNPTYLKVINTENDNIEYQGDTTNLSSAEFCITDGEFKNYKIEFFDEDNYADTSRLCIEEAILKPCYDACCEEAYIEAVRDTTVNSPFKCCWKFNVMDYNCDVFRVEVYDDYTFSNIYDSMTLDSGQSSFNFGNKRSDRYEYGDSNFLPYYAEGPEYVEGDTAYYTNDVIDVSTLADRITSQICISNQPGTNISPNANTHDNVKIRLFGANGEECILERDLECTNSQLCCDYVRIAYHKVIDPMDTTKCCWQFGFAIEEWIPSFCKGAALSFNKIIMYHDTFDLATDKYLSDLYPLNSSNFLPYFAMDSIDSVTTTQLRYMTPIVCQNPGDNPTNKIIIKLINDQGDTCTIDAQVNYCPTSEEPPIIEYTSSFNNGKGVNIDDLFIKVNELSTILDIEVRAETIKEYELNVYDLEGRRYNLPIHSNSQINTIDISNLVNGIYYLVLTSPNQVISKSFSIIR